MSSQEQHQLLDVYETPDSGPVGAQKAQLVHANGLLHRKWHALMLRWHLRGGCAGCAKCHSMRITAAVITMLDPCYARLSLPRPALLPPGTAYAFVFNNKNEMLLWRRPGDAAIQPDR